MAKVNIRVRPDGPYELRGEAEVVDGEGKKVDESSEEKTVFLCRCGGSKNKPFCDGSHRKMGFEG